MNKLITVSLLMIGVMAFVFGMFSAVFTSRPAFRATDRYEAMTGEGPVRVGNTNFLSRADLAGLPAQTAECYLTTASDGAFLSDWLDYNIVVVIVLSVIVVALSSIMLSKGIYVTVRDLTSNQ